MYIMCIYAYDICMYMYIEDAKGCKNPLARCTPYAYDNKTLNFAQGLDFLSFLKGKRRKTKESIRKNLGIPGSKFLLIHFLGLDHFRWFRGWMLYSWTCRIRIWGRNRWKTSGKPKLLETTFLKKPIFNDYKFSYYNVSC